MLGISTEVSTFKGVISRRAPRRWAQPCTNVESTLHQLSPYIGKLKSSIARDLILAYSNPGDLILDPFAGSGTVPLEAALMHRRVLAADSSNYSELLVKAKLFAPPSLEVALTRAKEILRAAQEQGLPDLRGVPGWVRSFFHPRTLKEALRFANICRTNDFLMACFLGILHHQRPGFLSYPSSHLVPYLRGRKFPRTKYPELYQYRALAPRLFAKIERAYKRYPQQPISERQFQRTTIQDLVVTESIDSIITSPPYMNALDYQRDNRLRLWFIDPSQPVPFTDAQHRRNEFAIAIEHLARLAETRLRPRGFCVAVVGEQIRRSGDVFVSQWVRELMLRHAPSLRLKAQIVDRIPDIRRARREFHGTKTEHILVFRKEPNA